MRTLLLGSGGRESALAAALARSRAVTDLLAAPGNPGIATVAECHDVDASNPRSVLELARRVDAQLVVIGPEAPLVAGAGDVLREDGRGVFGPNAAAARIEASKSYAKEMMARAGIPTSNGRTFETLEPAVGYLDDLGPPYVVKADGLAAGKGVVVTEDRAVAVQAIEDRLVGGKFGAAGRRIVIEEFLDGEEASIIAFTDGRSIAVCEPAQDYKRALDGDRGGNTGGMGSYSPVPSCSPDMVENVIEGIVKPMVRATADAGAPFIGALYAGIALTSRGPRVVEFNARFGDPETQALIPRLESDLGEACMACATGEAEGLVLEWSSDACVTVVAASGGYPGEFRTGAVIDGVDDAAAMEGVHVFHAGTAVTNGALVTAGGRVLSVSALGSSFHAARAKAYDALSHIRFEGMQHRSDIALRAEEAERSVT